MEELERAANSRAKSIEIKRLWRCIDSNAACSLCLEPFEFWGELTTTQCVGRHVFHKKCMIRLKESRTFRRDPRCPVCRGSLPKDPVQSDDEQMYDGDISDEEIVYLSLEDDEY